VNVISKAGLTDLIASKSKNVQAEALAWYRTAKITDWKDLLAVQRDFRDADMVEKLLVFNIRRNRYRLIVFPAFTRHTLYIKALLDHKEYDKGDWKTKWP
jgi:mRNA interferase HigB